MILGGFAIFFPVSFFLYVGYACNPVPTPPPYTNLVLVNQSLEDSFNAFTTKVEFKCSVNGARISYGGQDSVLSDGDTPGIQVILPL